MGCSNGKGDKGEVGRLKVNNSSSSSEYYPRNQPPTPRTIKATRDDSFRSKDPKPSLPPPTTKTNSTRNKPKARPVDEVSKPPEEQSYSELGVSSPLRVRVVPYYDYISDELFDGFFNFFKQQTEFVIDDDASYSLLVSAAPAERVEHYFPEKSEMEKNRQIPVAIQRGEDPNDLTDPFGNLIVVHCFDNKYKFYNKSKETLFNILSSATTPINTQKNRKNNNNNRNSGTSSGFRINLVKTEYISDELYNKLKNHLISQGSFILDYDGVKVVTAAAITERVDQYFPDLKENEIPLVVQTGKDPNPISRHCFNRRIVIFHYDDKFTTNMNHFMEVVQKLH